MNPYVSKEVYRVLDANANRASEGLRVVEEIVRFVMDREQLTDEVKKCRHELSEALAALACEELLLEAREAGQDVGAKTFLTSEERREGLAGLFKANIKRVQEAARVLEEYAKLAGYSGAGFKEIRFKAYTLEKSIDAALQRQNLVEVVKSGDVYVVTGEQFSLGRPTVEVVQEALAGGVKVVQLREKEWPTKDLVEVGAELRALTKAAGAALIVNDRIDVAMAVDADGAHIGHQDMPPALARKLLGPEKILGISAENLEEAVQAEKDGADYIGLGAIFPTATKNDLRGSGGLAMLTKVRAKVKVPIVAIGGIKAHNAAEVIRAGADSVAVVTEVVGAQDVRAATENLREIVQGVKTQKSL